MPKYPFTPEILDTLPEELAELFRGLELTLLEEICTRLKLADDLNEVTIDMIRALRAHGIPLQEIEKAIADVSGTGLDKLQDIMSNVVARNQAYYMFMIDFAHVTKPARLVNEQDVESIRRQTIDDYTNITQSMGFYVGKGARRILIPPGKAYQWALDQAAVQVQSGAVSYGRAISLAVKQLAASGLKTVSWESGHVDQVDVSVRRAVLTGINQVNQKYREQSMEYLHTDLVEVTAHSGARDVDGPNGWENHKKWQGGVYRWTRRGNTLIL